MDWLVQVLAWLAWGVVIWVAGIIAKIVVQTLLAETVKRWTLAAQSRGLLRAVENGGGGDISGRSKVAARRG